MGFALQSEPTRLNPVTILVVVANHFEVDPSELAKRTRRREILLPRQIAMYLCRKYTDASLKQIGRLLNKQHPSVSNAFCVIEQRLRDDEKLALDIRILSGLIEQAETQATERAETMIRGG